MRRRISPVGLIFIALAVFSAAGAAQAIAQLVSDGGTGRAVVAVYSIVRCLIAVVFMAFVITRGPARRRVHEPRALLACTLAMGSLVALGAPDSTDAGAQAIFGEAVAVAGCAWLLVSVMALGRCFGILPEARGLVTRGPYRIIRHPVYLGELTAAAGLLIAGSTLANLLLFSTFAAAQTMRMRMEERELTRAFPEYSDYAARTPRLLPRLRVTPPVHITTGDTT
jgi:protein-S-isoprenylcysteine O-methyltransferase Ste14